MRKQLLWSIVSLFLLSLLSIHVCAQSGLHEAVRKGDPEKTKELLAKKAKVNAFDEQDMSPLMICAETGNTEIAQILLDHKAKVNSRNKSKKTALMIAAEKGHESMLKLLLDHGAKTDYQDKNGLSALMLSAYEGHLKCCALLVLGGAKMELKDHSGNTALVFAIEQGHYKITEYLLGKGANPNTRDNINSSALIYAVRQGSMETIQLLVENGANMLLMEEGPFLFTALMYAAETENMEAVEYLIQKEELLLQGPDSAFINYKRGQAMIIAANKGNFEMLRFFVEHGTYIDAYNRNGYTALMYAVFNEHDDIAYYLIEKGANVNAKHLYGKTALDLAKSDAMKKALLNAGAKHGYEVY
jgi:uncharacterized protein